MPAEKRSRALIVLLAAVVALLLSSCALPPILGGGEDSRRGSSQQPPGEMPTALHPALRDCAPAGGEGSLTLADVDLEQATWATPEGFHEVSGYHEDNPVEKLGWIWVAGADDLPPHTLNVISVNYYSDVAWNEFADDCEAVPLEAVKERLAQYRVHIGARELSDPQMTEINGYPAIQQDIGLTDYDYEGYWLFSTSQLLHVYCQWEDPGAEELIRTGCKDLVASLQIP